MSWEEGNQRPRVSEYISNEELAKISGTLEEKDAKLLLYQFLRMNPTFAAELIFGVRLFPFQHVLINGMFKSDYSLAVLSRGMSKCRKFSDLLQTSNGIKKIIDVNVGEKVLSKDAWNRVEDKIVNAPQPTYKLVSRRGYECEGLDYHRILVLTQDLNLEWKPITEIKVGDCVAMRHGEFGCQQIDFRNGFTFQKRYATQKVIDTYSVSENDWYYFFGIFIGDGYFSKNVVSITSADVEIENFLKAFSEKLGLSLKIRTKSSSKIAKDYILYNASLRDFLVYCGFIIGKKAVDKIVPYKLLQCSAENCAALLRGLYDTDGYCVKMPGRRNSNGVKIGFTSCSEELIRQVRTLLLCLKIESSTRLTFKGGMANFPGNKQHACNKAWTILINDFRNAEIFKEKVNFYILRKSNILNVLNDAKFSQGEFSDYIPYVGEYLTQKYKKKGFSYSVDGVKVKTAFRKKTSRRLLSRTIASVDEEDKIKLAALLSENIFFDEIKEISTGNEVTVDIQVENEHCYVSDGFINHNSWTAGIYAALDCILNQGIETGILSKSFRQCIEQSSIVLTSKGPQQIKDVVVGDFIFARNTSQKILNKWINPVSDGLKITTIIDNKSLTGKKEHKILVRDYSGNAVYKQLDELVIGDVVLLSDRSLSSGEFIGEKIDIVSSITPVKDIVTVDIEVENEHCYWGEGFINHNSKMIFRKIEDIAAKPEAAFLKQCITKVSKSNDEWVMEFGKSRIRALPLGDGEKLRGFRFHRIVIDEFLLMPDRIYTEVIVPFLSVVQNPTQREDLYKAETRLIEADKMREEDRYVWPNNKLIALSSASFKFEYLYKLYEQFDTLIHNPKKDEVTRRCIMQLSYDCAPEQLYDKNLLNQAKAQMSESQFLREFGAQFTDDSSGYFKTSKMALCTVPDGEMPCVEIVGDPDSEYIVSVDPSWSETESSDDFAIQVIKINTEKQIGTLVHPYALAGASLKDHIRYFLYILQNFNVVAVCMDYNGGVQFMNSCNESEVFKDAKIELKPLTTEFEKPEEYNQNLVSAKSEYNKTNYKMVILRKPTSGWIRVANELLQANFDHRRMFFASRAIDDHFRAQTKKKIGVLGLTFCTALEIEKENEEAKMIDFVEHLSDMILMTKTQCALIQISTSSQGMQTFDLPHNLKRKTGPDKPRKDSYAALVLGNWMCKIYFDMQAVNVEEVAATFEPMFIN